MAHPRAFADLDDPAWERVFGGEGGVPFDDAVLEGDLLSQLWLASGSLVDSVQVEYRNRRRGSRHGGLGGAGGWTPFERGEVILALGGRVGRHVEYLSIRTDRRTLEAGDRRGGGGHFLLAAPEGHHIVALHGRCGRYLDAVGVRLAPLPPPAHSPEELARAALQGMK